MQKQFASRITQARSDAELSQDEAAKLLSMSRTVLSELETGKREISIVDLEKIADVYQRDISFFLKAEEEEAPFAVLLRASHGQKEIQGAISKFEFFCNKYEQLYSVLDFEKTKTVYACDSRIEPHVPIQDTIEMQCQKIREALGVSSAPLTNLRSLLEDKLNISVFYFPLDKKVSGMFTFSGKTQNCYILVNSDHSPGRRLFSLAHELGHFVFHRNKIGLISRDDLQNREEEVANLFAENLLMPRQAVMQIFYDKIRDKKDIFEEDVLYLADNFGVSFQAMAIRLRKLKLISASKTNEFIDHTWVGQLRQMTGLEEKELAEASLPKNYRHLTVKAYRKEKLTLSAMSEFLDLDIITAKKLATAIPEKE